MYRLQVLDGDSSASNSSSTTRRQHLLPCADDCRTAVTLLVHAVHHCRAQLSCCVHPLECCCKSAGNSTGRAPAGVAAYANSAAAWPRLPGFAINNSCLQAATSSYML
jgi:hypothetical protein